MRPAALVALGVFVCAALFLLVHLMKSVSKTVSGTASVSGRVVDDATGEPLPAAQVWVTRFASSTALKESGRSERAPVAKDGRFRLPRAKASRLWIEAACAGHAPQGLDVEPGPKGWQGELRLRAVGDMALPSGQGEVSVSVLGGMRGWDLEAGAEAAPGASDISPQSPPGIEPRLDGLRAPKGGGFLPAGARAGHLQEWEFASSVEAPAEGYLPRLDLSSKESIWYVRTRSGKYARILLLEPSASADSARQAAFLWVFQPDGSRRLGEPFHGPLRGEALVGKGKGRGK